MPWESESGKLPETRKYTKAGRRDIISGVEILGKGSESALICAPIAAIDIARKLVRNRGYWRTTYAMAYGDSSYTLPTPSEMDSIEEILNEFLEATTLMDCGDLITELDDIEQAITALSLGGGCGCGSGGAGATSPPADDTDTGDITLSTGTPPDGYPDWATYQVAKCDIATMIIADLLSDVIWWQTVTIATLTLGGLSAGMLSILSAFTLTAILAGLLALLAYNITFLVNAQEAIESGFSDLVCAILAGETSQESMDNFISEMETQVDLEMTDPIARFLVKQLLGQWADTTLFNLLYADYDDFLARQIPTGADCSDCGMGCHRADPMRGTYLGGDVWQSVFWSSYHRVEVRFNQDAENCPGDTCGPMEEIEMSDLTGWTVSASSRGDFRVWSDAACPITSDNMDVYDSDTPPTENFCCRYYYISSSTAFTVKMGRLGHCF